MSLLAIPVILIILGFMLYGLGFLLAFVGFVAFNYVRMFYKMGRWLVLWFVAPFKPVTDDS